MRRLRTWAHTRNTGTSKGRRQINFDDRTHQQPLPFSSCTSIPPPRSTQLILLRLADQDGQWGLQARAESRVLGMALFFGCPGGSALRPQQWAFVMSTGRWLTHRVSQRSPWPGWNATSRCLGMVQGVVDRDQHFSCMAKRSGFRRTIVSFGFLSRQAINLHTASHKSPSP
ncbi:hypothetical protein K505DRAFT_4497 [Melanomma pulvis-pyrius CBS 109.77]|uniref:Uncharacterized protein n=1 Tax=Melanomma pulvis-pyrius CBS 109.77 TaxID=1314802 RepID=A0A6A6XHV8_9PLEO|nr:hypothetical protein K505DRAFT_4497 [Melanomma pulvis-pyrius CBS 109.77]